MAAISLDDTLLLRKLVVDPKLVRLATLACMLKLLLSERAGYKMKGGTSFFKGETGDELRCYTSL